MSICVIVVPFTISVNGSEDIQIMSDGVAIMTSVCTHPFLSVMGVSCYYCKFFIYASTFATLIFD